MLSGSENLSFLHDNDLVCVFNRSYSLSDDDDSLIFEIVVYLLSDLKIGLPAEIEARKKQYEFYREKLLAFHEISN